MEIDFLKLCTLTRLRFDAEESVQMRLEIEHFFETMSDLPPLDDSLSFIDPGNAMVLRPDTPMPSQKTADLLKNAPVTRADCIVVPKLVDSEVPS